MSRKLLLAGVVLMAIPLCVYLWSLGEIGTRGEEGASALMLLSSFLFGVPGFCLAIIGSRVRGSKKHIRMQ